MGGVGGLKAPFPYFGRKSRVAPLVWSRFGDVPNYVEPFFGSGAVLLSRPSEPRIETVNDLDGFIANFWRAVQHDPDAVAQWADWPVNENDLHARHMWLVQRRGELHALLDTDPDAYDAKIAGWWVCGICQWIGSGWCAAPSPAASADGGAVAHKLPHLTSAGMGVHRQLPHLGDAGRGIMSGTQHIAVGADAVEAHRENLVSMMRELQARLRRVRVCSGDWTRILGPTPTTKQGLTAVFLDPPYAESERDANIYAVETNVSAAVREWALTAGDDPLLRIALCGYDGEHEMPATWEAVPWKAHGGYGSQGTGRGRENATREMVWFSPHCLKPDRPQQLDLFAQESEEQ